MTGDVDTPTSAGRRTAAWWAPAGLAAAIMRVLAAALVAVGVLAPSASAAVLDDAAAGLQDGVWVQEGSGQDALALRRVVIDHADAERVAIVVLAGGLASTPEAAADALLDRVSADTVLLFTPDDVAVASRVHTSAEVDAAFAAAGGRALDAESAVAARAILDALATEPPARWPVVLGVVALVALGFAALHLVRRRREAVAVARELDEQRSDMRARIQSVADRILEVDEHVTRTADPSLAEDLALATREYQDALWYLERITRAEQLPRLERRIATAEQMLADLRRRVG